MSPRICFFPGPPQPRSKPCLALYNPDRIRTVPWSEKKHHTTPRPRKTCRIQSFTRAAPSISRALTQLHKSRSRSPPAGGYLVAGDLVGQRARQRRESPTIAHRYRIPRPPSSLARGNIERTAAAPVAVVNLAERVT